MFFQNSLPYLGCNNIIHVQLLFICSQWRVWLFLITFIVQHSTLFHKFPFWLQRVYRWQIQRQWCFALTVGKCKIGQSSASLPVWLEPQKHCDWTECLWPQQRHGVTPKSYWSYKQAKDWRRSTCAVPVNYCLGNLLKMPAVTDSVTTVSASCLSN